MNDILYSPMFGILVSMIAFEVALWLFRKTKLTILNPLLMTIVFVIVFLLVTQIDIEAYAVGGDIINMFLGPATVALAIPLYKQIESLKRYKKAILIGILIGSMCGMVATLLCAMLFQFQPEIIASLLPKSITTPIGIEVSKALGGIPSITVLNILITGILGAVMAEFTLSFFHIKHPLAKGIAIGTSAHALGTTKAFSIGEVEGAMSSLAIGVAGIITVFIAPLLWELALFFL